VPFRNDRMRRREFLLTPLVLAAQTKRREIAIFNTPPPEELRSQCVVFPRAYTCCPEPAAALRALETSRYPNAARPEDPTLIAFRTEPFRADPNLISVFTSAAGDGVDSPLESSIRVPLAIWAPGVFAPRAAEEILISTVDLAPTLLALRGDPVPDHTQGRDLSALLLRRSNELPDSVYIEGGIGTVAEWRAVIRGFDKAVMDLSGNVTHLYNLAEDPEERSNLVLDPNTQLTRDALVALARVWMRRLGDGIDPSGLRRR